MKMSVLLIITGSALLSVAACATKPDRSERPEPPDGLFATHIDEEGLKKFQYTIELPERSKSAGRNGRPGNMSGQVAGNSRSGMYGGMTAGTGGGGRQAPSGAYSYERFRQLNDQLDQMLELELKKSGFCHEGHRETERVTEPPIVFVRGECTETASEDDREQYPNLAD